MLEKLIERIKKCNFKSLEEQFELEDLYKEILYFQVKNGDSTKFTEQLLNDRLSKRKNLYIYPEKVNV